MMSDHSLSCMHSSFLSFDTTQRIPHCSLSALSFSLYPSLTESTSCPFLPSLLPLSDPYFLFIILPALHHSTALTHTHTHLPILVFHSGCAQVIKRQNGKQTVINLKNNKKHLPHSQRNPQKEMHQPCHCFPLKKLIFCL